MTPKEKAKELRDKYMNVRWDIGLDDAKQCALIAVYEILNEPSEVYWREVKQEIEKL
jgi:hypothetical protein